MTRIRRAARLGVVALGVVALEDQQASQTVSELPQQPAIRAAGEEVPLHAAVRDRRGRAVVQ